MSSIRKAKSLAGPCLGCLKPRCESFCPAGNDIGHVISLLKEGKEEEAASLLYSKNPFPELTSRLCDVNKQCRGNCVKGLKDEPVSTNEIERLVSSTFRRPYEKGEPNGKRVAIVGAGIAGCTSAFFLSSAGYEVHMFEKETDLGGAVYTGIPSFRINKSYLKDIKEDLLRLGVELNFGVLVGKKGQENSIDDLRKTHDYVILCIGAEKENEIGFALGKGTISGLRLLRLLNLHSYGPNLKEEFDKAIVLGGGNVALDCALSLKPILKDVKVFYRRGEAEMPASKDVVALAKAKGISFSFLANIKGLCYERGSLSRLRTVEMALGELDSSSRRSCHEIEGSEKEIDAKRTLVVFAIGERSEALDYCLEGDNVIFAGDCRYGAKTLAHAINDGREAARRIIQNERK